MRYILLLCLCTSGCTFYSINVNILEPENLQSVDKPSVNVEIVIKDNNDADTTQTQADVSTI